MQKIKTLIFDFGDVFINLDKKGAMQNALNLFNLETFDADMIETNILYEIGKISTSEFIAFYKTKFPNLSQVEIINAWNYIIKDFPKHRLDFIKYLSQKKDYQLILLSNTNHMHIDFVKQNVSFFEDFKNCFDVFYLSQEIHLRKPNRDIFEFVLEENNLTPNECLFIDDTKDNTDTAKTLGFKIWNIDETKEDVIDVFKIKKRALLIYLLLSILSSTAIFVVFKLFDKYKVNTLQAIVVNYITAFTCGLMLTDEQIVPSEIIQTNWFLAAIGLGFLFIAIFYVMALTAQKNGLSVVSVASKMSVIIPVIFGIYVYNESIGAQKIIGIIIALIAVYLTSIKQKNDAVLTHSIYLPVILFFGTGIIDTSVNHFAPDHNIPIFTATIFAIAAIIGILILTYKYLILKSIFKFSSIPFGIALGIVNYCSIYFLLLALRVENTESSALFTINNIAILTLSTLTGLLLFKERISNKNWIGILLALIAILLVTLS